MTSKNMSPLQLCYAWHQADCRVTITGADDKVDPSALVELSQKYPFVEWGILVSHDLYGSPRYPTLDWVYDALNLIILSGCHYAIHLCGSARRGYQSGSESARSMVSHLTAGLISPTQCRVQLNGFE